MTDQHYTVIGRLKLTPIDGARTLQQAEYKGMKFAVGIDYTEDNKYVIFLPDGQLSKEYAEANDCVGYTDENGKKQGGFFAKNRKVRSINLMKGKIKSVGYVAQLSSLDYTGCNLNELKEGMSFSELNGVPVSNKFVNRATMASRQRNAKRVTRREIPGVPRHPDTKQFYREVDNIIPGSEVWVTEKLDGTSVRFGIGYETPEPTRLQRWLSRWLPEPQQQPKYAAGSRNVIMKDDFTGGTYYPGNMYSEIGHQYRDRLHTGETMYGEIVGWSDGGSPLFTRGGVKFIYGEPQGQRELYVYAITWTLPDGTLMQLPWKQVKIRCAELGMRHVPEIFPYPLPTTEMESFKQTVLNVTDGQSTIDDSHIREGVALRITRPEGTVYWLKSKSDEFYALEDKFKADESNVDIEEAA